MYGASLAIGARVYRDLDADYAKQLYIYSKAVYEEYGEFPKELWFNLYRAQKIEKVEFKEGDYMAALDWFKVAVDMILQEQEWECKPESWYCVNLCGFTDCVYNGRDMSD